MREEQTGEKQAGYRVSSGCVDQIFTIHMVFEHRFNFKRPTIIMSLDIHTAVGTVDSFTQCPRLLRNRVSGNYVSVLKVLYFHTSGHISAYNQLSLPFVLSIGVRHGCSISPSLFNFVVEDVLRNASSCLLDNAVKLHPESGALTYILSMISSFWVKMHSKLRAY